MSDVNWSQGGQGLAGGAMTGASLGSVLGPWGALGGGLIGGALGGLGGLFGGGGASEYEDRLRKLAAGYGSRQAPQAGPAAQGAYSDFRRNQAGLISQLEAMARGEGPSAAAIQMREAMDRAAGSQASAAAGAGGRGVNAGAALRGAMNNTAAIQAQGARDTATLRANEQMNAMGLLGQTTAQGRAADENMNQFNAGQQNQMSQANLDAQLRSLGINTQAELQAMQMAMGAAGPGLGTQLLGAGASAIGPALQYSMAQKQMNQTGAMQRQYMDYLQQQQQLNQARQSFAANPSTPNTGWGYQTAQAPGQPFPFAAQQAMPSWLMNLLNPMGLPQ